MGSTSWPRSWETRVDATLVTDVDAAFTTGKRLVAFEVVDAHLDLLVLVDPGNASPTQCFSQKTSVITVEFWIKVLTPAQSTSVAKAVAPEDLESHG